MEKADLHTPDEVLVVAAMLGDLDSFDTLARRYRRGVVRTAQAIVGRENAEDGAQEALLLAFKALPSLEAPGSFGAWLSAITRHCALRFDRRESSRVHSQVAIDDVLLERVPAITRPTIGMEEEGEIRKGLESINPDHALVLRLHYFDGMPLKRVAAYLGLSLATVKWRVYQGKRQLRDRAKRVRRKETAWRESRR